MEFSRHEYWSVLHFLLQENFLTQGLNLCLLRLLHCQVDSLPLSHQLDITELKAIKQKMQEKFSLPLPSFLP